MTTTIVTPEQKVTICDICGVTCDETNQVKKGYFITNETKSNEQGGIYVDSVKLDFCDTCLQDMYDMIVSLQSYWHPEE